jgi:hypothetical protein
MDFDVKSKSKVEPVSLCKRFWSENQDSESSEENGDGVKKLKT